MTLSIHASFLPHDDPELSLAFYRDVLGFEVRNDVGSDCMRWITLGPAGQPDTSVVLQPPAADPAISDSERRTIEEMMAKGTYARLLLATQDLDGTFATIEASGADIVQEPLEQAWPRPLRCHRRPLGRPLPRRPRRPPPATAQRRHLAGAEQTRRPGLVRHGTNRQAQPLEHATGPPGTTLARASHHLLTQIRRGKPNGTYLLWTPRSALHGH